MRISDWSSDVCSSDLRGREREGDREPHPDRPDRGEDALAEAERQTGGEGADEEGADRSGAGVVGPQPDRHTGEEGECVHGQGEEQPAEEADARSEEHTSELQSLMRISYAVFCLNNKIKFTPTTI